MALSLVTYGYLSWYLHKHEREPVVVEMSVRDNKNKMAAKGGIAKQLAGGANDELCASQLSLANCWLNDVGIAYLWYIYLVIMNYVVSLCRWLTVD